MICSIEKRLSLQLEVHSRDIFTLSERLDKAEKTNCELREENNALRRSVKAMTHQLAEVEGKQDDIGQEPLSTTLLVHGVRDAGVTPQEMKVKVISILNDKIADAKIELGEVSAVERMGKRAQTVAEHSTGDHIKVSPIVLKFASKESRDRVLKNRRQLKSTGVSITEQLTLRKAALLKQASDLVKSQKLEAAWSHDGKILIKYANKIVSISTACDLERYP